MKNYWMLLLFGLFILILSACGQGTAENGDNQQANPIETEQSNAIEEDTVDTEIEETNTDSTEVDTETEQTEQTVLEPTTMTVKLVFSDNNVMDMYLEDREITATDETLYQETLEAWITGPTADGLTSLVSTNVGVQSVEIIDGIAHVSFTKTLLDTQVGSGTEYMLLQQIAMTMKQFGYNETQILIDGEVYPELFGHIDTSEPVVAESIENYKYFN